MFEMAIINVSNYDINEFNLYTYLQKYDSANWYIKGGNGKSKDYIKHYKSNAVVKPTGEYYLNDGNNDKCSIAEFLAKVKNLDVDEAIELIKNEIMVNISESSAANIINSGLSYEKAKEQHLKEGRLEKFKAFEHICKNSFVKQLLYTRQHGRCPVCNGIIPHPENGIVHHVTYEGYCRFLSSKTPEIMIFHPQRDGKYYAMVPNCELCWHHPDFIDISTECLKNVTLLCGNKCHDIIYELEMKSTARCQ